MRMKLINLLVLLLLPLISSAEDWEWAPQHAIGNNLPDFSVTTTEGDTVQLSELSGEKGTLIMFSRSTVW